MSNPEPATRPALSVVRDTPPPAAQPLSRSAHIQALLKEIRAEGIAEAHAFAADLRALAERALVTSTMKGSVPQGVVDAARRLSDSLAAEALNIESLLARIA